MKQNRYIKTPPQAITQQEFNEVEVALALVLRTLF